MHPRRPDLVAGGCLGAQSLGGLGHGIRIEPLRRPPLVVLGPHVRAARSVAPEEVVVAEAVAEEVGALDPTADRLVLVVMDHHRTDAGHLRVDGPPHRHAGVDEGLLVVVDPRARLLGVDEGERQRAHALAGGEEDRLAAAAGDPQRGVRLLLWLRHHVARWHLDELAIDAGERHLDHAAQRRLETFQPRVALACRVDLEAAQLGLAGGLPAAELDAPVREQIEHGDPLGDTGGVVELRCGQHDAVTEADLLRPLAARGEEHLGRRRVAVLLEEVVLDLPDVLEAQ